MGELSMGARREITKKYTGQYVVAGKKDKGRMLDELCGATEWSRANTRGAGCGALETYGELGKAAGQLTTEVGAELSAMSPATIDRHLASTRKARYPAAKSATRASATLRNELTVRRAVDEMEARPGFFEIDLVAHCGHSLAGEHAWTLTATDVFTGWTSNVAIKNRAHRWVVQATQ